MEDRFKTQDSYEKHFEKHIVSSCNNPKMDNVKSCRAGFRKSRVKSSFLKSRAKNISKKNYK